ISRVAPGLTVEEVDVAGPPTSVALRVVGWVEAGVLVSALGVGSDRMRTFDGVLAVATVTDAGVTIWVAVGDPLDFVVLRSYCIGAAHMALGWVRSEGIAVDASGEVHDLTIWSFGVLRAVDMPSVEVEIEADDGLSVNVLDVVFA